MKRKNTNKRHSSALENMWREWDKSLAIHNAPVTIPGSHPARKSLDEFGLPKLTRDVEKAPRKGWEKALPKLPWRYSLRKVRLILDKERKFYLRREYKAYYKLWFYRDVSKRLKTASFKLAVEYINRYGDLIYGYHKSELTPAVTVLKKAEDIKRSKEKYYASLKRCKDSIWGRGKKECSFTSSRFFENTCARLYEYYSHRDTSVPGSKYDVNQHARLIRYVHETIEAYYGLRLSYQAVRKYFDRRP